MAIGFYAPRPVSLPHPPYPEATLRLVEKGIAEAWRIIRDQPEGDFKMSTASEDRITRELRTCLMNNVLPSGAVPGFTLKNFRVPREAKYESFDGTHLDKMPDLHIDIVRDKVSLPSADGLFVECKPVGPDHPAGGTYCDAGIIRFVNGEYAWAMHQGMMLGYTSPGYTIPKKLREALKTRKTVLKCKGGVRACRGRAHGGYLQAAHSTVHRRGFAYPGIGTKAPEIALRHLWLMKG